MTIEGLASVTYSDLYSSLFLVLRHVSFLMYALNPIAEWAEATEHKEDES